MQNVANTIQECVQFFTDEVATKKSKSAKARYINKQIALTNEALEDVQKAYSKPFGQRWLHGEQVNLIDLYNIQNELHALNHVKSKI